MRNRDEMKCDEMIPKTEGIPGCGRERGSEEMIS
jgi:hypothetical protein